LFAVCLIGYAVDNHIERRYSRRSSPEQRPVAPDVHIEVVRRPGLRFCHTHDRMGVQVDDGLDFLPPSARSNHLLIAEHEHPAPRRPLDLLISSGPATSSDRGTQSPGPRHRLGPTATILSARAIRPASTVRAPVTRPAWFPATRSNPRSVIPSRKCESLRRYVRAAQGPWPMVRIIGWRPEM